MILSCYHLICRSCLQLEPVTILTPFSVLVGFNATTQLPNEGDHRRPTSERQRVPDIIPNRRDLKNLGGLASPVFTGRT